MSPPPPPPQSPSLTHPTSLIFSLFLFYSKSTPNLTFKSPITTMPLTTTPTTHHHFTTPQSLSDWLRPRLPSDSFAAWGTKPGTKNVHNLWLELTQGETSLADSSPPVRTLQVVIVRIKDQNNRLLIESHHQLSNGDVRTRSRPLSEKMKPGETVEEAVVRAVKEELGKDEKFVRIIPGSYSTKVEQRVSVSYPGLPACYVLHTVDAFVDGLPHYEFCTQEQDEYHDHDHSLDEAESAVSCKTHYWKWVDDDDENK
ncbi:hypothetical protein QVD17_07464 [Tagetes erecta]|uniref:Nudix hydrolase domain-containing protein n=1 Tax=Tagetes erecta TaxID=13708 RepID=A0AAD8PC21_TARER|nr:hypothetical protein QVD17_07464 [Tagetes erecta]